MEVTVEILSASDFNAGLHRCSTPVRLVMEGLLAHFFSSDRPSYVSEDVLWFLKLANQQDQWCCNPFQGEEDNTEVEISARMAEMSVGVVAGGLEDDLISKLERSTLDAEKVEEEEVREGWRGGERGRREGGEGEGGEGEREGRGGRGGGL